MTPPAIPREPPRREWVLRDLPDGVDPASLHDDPLLGRLLALRGVGDAGHAARFLDAGLADLPDPTLLTDLDVAAERIAAACRSGERVAVHGDYDVDGVVSTTLLVTFLRRLDIPVVPVIPDRLKDGYGLGVEAVDRIADEAVSLLVTVDCGVTAHEALARAVERGLDVVVLDHHRLEGELPPAVAVVDPVREGPDGGAHGLLCATGIVFLALIDVRRRLRETQYFKSVKEPNLRNYMDLVALGTVADMVPLVGTNRLLVRHGLTVLANRRRPGMAALLQVAGVQPDDAVDASTCGFRLGPRINAAGRLAHANAALELLTCDDRGEAVAMAEELDRLNRRRRDLEDRVLDEAVARVEADGDFGDKRGIALEDAGWHPGVVGIVASRLVQRYHRPVVLLAGEGEEVVGSARSIRGVDLVASLTEGSQHMVRFGGHAAAAGLAVRRADFEGFRSWFEREAFAAMAPDTWTPRLEVDAEWPVEEVDRALALRLEQLEPHGIGNPRPRFLARDVEVRGVRTVRRGAIQMKLGPSPGLGAIAFRSPLPADQLGRRIDLVYGIQRRRFRGAESIQLQIEDLRNAHGDAGA